MTKVRIISIRFDDGYITSEIFEYEIPKNKEDEFLPIVSRFLMIDENFDEYRVIFPDLSERIWRSSQINKEEEEE